MREASRTLDAEICISFSLYSICVSPNMGSLTVIHLVCSLGNTILPLIQLIPLRVFRFRDKPNLNILSARGLAHSERQRNVKNITLRNTELHNTKEAIYFTTLKITFIKHPKEIVFLPCCEPVSFCAFGAPNRVQFAWAKIYTQKTFNVQHIFFIF